MKYLVVYKLAYKQAFVHGIEGILVLTQHIHSFVWLKLLSRFRH